MNHPVILFLLIATFIIDIYILLFALTRKDSSRSIYVFLITFASAIYGMASILLAMAKTDDGALTALRLLNLGAPMLAPGLLLIVMRMYKPKWLKPWMIYAVVIYGFMIFTVVFFTHQHKLFYSRVELHPVENYVILERAAIYWVNQVISLICIILSCAVMLMRFIKGDRKIRSKMLYLITATLAIVIANILNITNALPKHFDIMPFALKVSLIFFALDMAKHKFWDIVSVASATALETMENAIIVLNEEWGFLYCNISAKALFPQLESFPETEAISKVSGWPAKFETVEHPAEIVFVREDKSHAGGKFTYRAITKKITDERRRQIGWYVVIHDITSMTILFSQLKDLATTDPLTGVSNRRHFLERVNTELAMAAPGRLNLSTALIMYDLDNFKKVNDTYGHAAGDYILCAVVETIKQKLRSYDIMARYGGEEFVIFMMSSDGTGESLHKFASRLCKSIESARFVYDGKLIPMTASFGAVNIHPGDSFSDAMLAVDEAMYKAKKNGKNQVVIGEIKKSETPAVILKE